MICGVLSIVGLGRRLSSFGPLVLGYRPTCQARLQAETSMQPPSRDGPPTSMQAEKGPLRSELVLRNSNNKNQIPEQRQEPCATRIEQGPPEGPTGNPREQLGFYVSVGGGRILPAKGCVAEL